MRIEIVGPIGVGKSTLAEKLAELGGWNVVNEPVEGNPFLRAHYKHQGVFSFENTQFYLLHYLHDIKKQELPENRHKVTVFDHGHALSMSYTSLMQKTEDEQGLINDLARMIEKYPPPDIIIHLVAPADVIVDRVRGRGRPFEKHVDVQFVEKLQAEIARQVDSLQNQALVIRVDSEKLDFAKNPADVDLIYTVVRHHLDQIQGPSTSSAFRRILNKNL